MIAFTFPGQGSQKPGMGQPWVDHDSWELVAEASEATERDIDHLLLHADADELRHTRNSQLSTYVLSLVVLDAVERLGVDATFMAGHSLGEYSALTAAGALDFADGVRLVAERGEAMQVASEDQAGTMAAVLGLDDDQVDIACVRAADDVWVANYNAPGQVVIAGSREGIDAAAALAKELGAKRVMPLPVGGAFHTPFMAAARDRLKKALAEVELRDPDEPVVANVDATAHTEAADWAGLLIAQLCSPVRWRQTLHTLAESNVTTFVELGPGTVLTGLAKRTVDGARTLSVATPDDLDALLEALEGQPGPALHVVHEGEHLFMTERVVVSPAAGIFEPATDISPGSKIGVGDRLGVVAGEDVRSPFEGTVMGLIAVEGERVTSRQPIAWLRTA
ncbi:MAG: ACP S-malonyltransferase [Acidimicrobiales bacterium]